MRPKTSKTMNVSLTPELHRMVKARVASGLYTSASELVREALRLLARSQGLQVEDGDQGDPDLAASQWREVRSALLDGQQALTDERARDLDDLFLAAILMTRARLAREMPEASEEERKKHLAQWLQERAGASALGDVGKPVAPDRLRRMRGA